MIRDRDFKPFQVLMDELSAAMRGGFKAQDVMVSAYWDALKDCSLAELQGNVKRIIATATTATPFPKPRELRLRAPQIANNPQDAALTAASRRAEQSWREVKARDPVAFQIEYGFARAFHELAQLDVEDPGYGDWLRIYQQWASVRFAPRAEQEAAVARYGGALT